MGPAYELWVWGRIETIRPYYSDNGVDWTADANGDITNTLFSGSAPACSIFILYEDGMYTAWADNNESGDCPYSQFTAGDQWISQEKWVPLF